MAEPLNVFKTITADLTTGNEIVYTAPDGKTAIILMAQISNVTTTAAATSFLHLMLSLLIKQNYYLIL